MSDDSASNDAREAIAAATEYAVSSAGDGFKLLACARAVARLQADNSEAINRRLMTAIWNHAYLIREEATPTEIDALSEAWEIVAKGSPGISLL